MINEPQNSNRTNCEANYDWFCAYIFYNQDFYTVIYRTPNKDL